jgi:hypothetical protein
MTTFWGRHRRRGLNALAALLVLAGVGTLSVAAQPATEGDPLALFAELMPVFSSPRCTNCHGGTNPQTDLNHLGGQIDVQMDSIGNMNSGTGSACLECHTAPAAKAGDWHLAPKPMVFVNKDTLAMCRQLRFFNTLRDPAQRAVFSEHLHNDPLIGLAFVGRGGIDDDSPFADDVSADPPPMAYGEFLSAAQRWVDEGQAACSNKWTGTITETTSGAERVVAGPATRVVSTELQVTTTVVENVATSDMHWVSKDLTDVPTKECQVYSYQTFTADRTKVPVTFQVVLDIPKLPAGGFTIPVLPPGMELPPCFEMPELPPGFVMPEMAAPEPVLMWQQVDGPEIMANHHNDSRSMPGCRTVVTDTPQQYPRLGGTIQVKATESARLPYGDPENPNHLVGEKVIASPDGKSTMIITWDLIRDLE